jgi:hypothetical protein
MIRRIFIGYFRLVLPQKEQANRQGQLQCR